LLICRYRPRGVAKADETWDAWCRNLGPSPGLHAAFYGKNGSPVGWQEYQGRYLEEMQAQKERIGELAALLDSGARITLLCSKACEDPSRCHRTLLAGLVEQDMEKEPGRHTGAQPNVRKPQEAAEDSGVPEVAKAGPGRRKKPKNQRAK
jgi:uncharacterized protein YeaO (DUF488 family)